MRKGWLIFLLVVIISAQLVVLSSFHDVETDGLANGNSVIAVAKWNYVQAVVRISVTPVNFNGTSHVKMVLPNGSNIDIGPTPQLYAFALQLPRTGDSFGNGAISGPLSLSQSQPVNIAISQNVGNVSDYVSNLKSESSTSLLPIDIYVIVIYGQAQVSVSGYGMGL